MYRQQTTHQEEGPAQPANEKKKREKGKGKEKTRPDELFAESVEVFAETGALLSMSRDDLKKMFVSALDLGQPSAFRLLLENGTKRFINDPLNNNKDTALHLVCANKNAKKINAEKVKILLEFGANPRAKNVSCWTPLHVASAVSTPEILTILLENGAKDDIDAGARIKKLKSGIPVSKTPLALAFTASDDNALKRIRVLLNFGADIFLYGNFYYINRDWVRYKVVEHPRIREPKKRCLRNLARALDITTKTSAAYAGILDAYKDNPAYFIILVKDILCNRTLFAKLSWLRRIIKNVKNILLCALNKYQEFKDNQVLQCLLAFHKAMTDLDFEALAQAYRISSLILPL